MQQNIEQQQLNTVGNNEKSGDLLQLKDLFYHCLSKWYCFLLSVLICIGVAIFYILRTPPIYVRTTEIQVKSEGQGKSVPGGVQSFNDLGIFRSNTNVFNELKVFQSPDNMTEIVTRLNLDMNYSVDGTFHPQTLYGTNLPVIISIDDLDDQDYVSFDIVFQGSDYIINKLVYNKKISSGEIEQSFKGKLGASVNTPAGRINVLPSPIYTGIRPSIYPSIHVSRVGIYNTVMRYTGSLNISRDNKDTDVITISCSDVSTERAEDILNTLTTVYNEKWVEDKNKITESTSKFIKERLGIIASDLNDVDEGISNIKSRNLVPDISSAADMYMNQNAEMNNRILELNNTIEMVKYIYDFVSKSNKNTVIPVTSGLGSTSIDEQINSYNTLVIDRNNKVAISSEQNSSVVQADATIETLRRAIVSSLNNQLNALRAQLKNLKKRENEMTGKIAASPNQAKNLLSVDRQQKVKESLYLFLLQKLEENELSQAFTAYNTRIVRKPGGDISPSSPKRNKILMIALLIGLLIPLAIIYLKEQLNTTIRGRQDLSKLNIPFLGEIPQAKDENRHYFWQSKFKEEKTNRIVIKQGKRDVINEAFRVVRTNLEFMTKEDRSSVIVITSYNVNSGKTFTSFNLSATISLKGKKVLIIDGDLRKASISAYVNSPKVGLSNYLNGQIMNVDDIIVKHSEFENLYVLPVGVIPPNPTELISETRFNELIEQLRTKFDLIIIDCPPIEILADTQIIEKQADRTLFIIRVGLMERVLLNDLKDIYENNKFKKMSMILNGTYNESGHYGRYGYHYGYGYGSRYGYGSHYGYEVSEKKKKKFLFF